MSRAEYMRAYRARTKTGIPDALPDKQRIAELEAEIKHLKAELAKRETFDKAGTRMTVNVPASIGPNVRDQIAGSFNSRPFTPAPKKGK
jgi:hypothetical protein